MFLLKDENMTADPQPTETPAYPTDVDVDAIVAEFKGDARAAIKALLADLDALARDRNSSVSFGYVYGRLAVVRSKSK